MYATVASITDKWITNVMQNNATQGLQSLVIHTELCVGLCTYMPVFTTLSCMSDVTLWNQKITKNSHLTAHISTTLEDTDTRTHLLTKPPNFCQALKAMIPAESMEGVGTGSARACGGGGLNGGEKERVSRIDREKGGGRK